MKPILECISFILELDYEKYDPKGIKHLRTFGYPNVGFKDPNMITNGSDILLYDKWKKRLKNARESFIQNKIVDDNKHDISHYYGSDYH